MRDLIKPIETGKFSQGAIFNCLKLNGSDSSYGIVITARCDIEQKKCKSVICLPIYQLHEYISNGPGFKERLMKNMKSRIDQILDSAGLPLDALDTYGYKDVITKISKNKDKKLLTDLENAINQNNYTESEDIKKHYCNYIRDIIEGKVSHLFFMESITIDYSCDGYIVDFNNPISIPFEDMLKLASGIVYKECLVHSTLRRSSLLYFQPTKGNDNLNFISQLCSPYVEQLLQKFCFFISRIGVDDVEKELFDKLINKG